MWKKGSKTLEQIAKEKLWEFCSSEARSVCNDLITYMDLECGKCEKSVKERKRGYAKFIITMPKNICPEKVTRDYICRLIKKFEKISCSNHLGEGTVIIRAFTSFMRRGLYNKQELLSWDNPKLLSDLEESKFYSIILLKNALNMNIPFAQMKVVRCTSIYNKKEGLHLLVFDTSNEFLQNLLLKMVFDVPSFYNYVCTYKNQEITRRFAESFGDLPVPQNIAEFTTVMFRQQILFFFHHTSLAEVCVIKAIYVHIIMNLQGEGSPFTIENGMDVGFVMRCDVVKCLKEGYRLVKLSLLKEVPSFDNWLVVVDDQTGICSDILRKNRHISVSFHDIPPKYRSICKRWFIYSKDIFTAQRSHYLIQIKRFIMENEIKHQQVQSLQNTGIDITFQDVMSYIIKDGKVVENSRAALVSFLSYLKKTDDISVDAACLKYIPSRNHNANGNDKQYAIPKDDYRKLLDGLRDNSQKDGAYTIEKITFAVFVIMSLVELRPSSILTLRLSDIKEYGNGQYCIVITTKTSRSHQKTYVIRRLVYEILMKVVDYTSTFRDNAPPNIKNMLFISPNGKIISSLAINRVIKSVCRKCGIKKYTLSHIRKTYMTNVAKSIRSSGGSVVGMEQLFDHKNLETTFTSYVKISKEEILMTISGTDSIKPYEKIRKHILSDIDMDKKQLVAEGSGYCQQEFCQVDGMAECFICPHFITSLSFYNSFILKREKIKKLLAAEGFGKEILEGYQLILNILDKYITAMDEMNLSKRGKVL